MLRPRALWAGAMSLRIGLEATTPGAPGERKAPGAPRAPAFEQPVAQALLSPVATGGRLALVLAAGERAVSTGALTQAQQNARTYKEKELKDSTKAVAAAKKAVDEQMKTIETLKTTRTQVAVKAVELCRTTQVNETKTQLAAAQRELDRRKATLANAQKDEVMARTVSQRLDKLAAADDRRDQRKAVVNKASAGAKSAAARASGAFKGMGKKTPSDAAYALDDLDLNQAAVGGPGRRLYEAVKSYEDGNPVPAMDPGLPPGWDPPVKLMGVPDAYPYLVGQMIATQATDFGNVLSSMGNIGPGYTFHNLAGDVYTYYAGLMQGRVYDRGNGGTVAIPVNEEPRGAAAGTRKQHFMNVFITAVQTVMVDPDQMRTVQGHEAIATTPVQARTDALARGFRDLYDMYGWEVATAIEMFAEAKLVLLSTQIVLHTDKDKYGRPITPPLERLFRPEDWRRLTTPSSDPNNRMSLLDTYLPKGKKFRWIIDPAQPGDDVRAATDAISALMYYLWLIQEHEGASRHGVRFDTLAQGQPGQVMLANKRKYFVQLLKLGLIKVRQRQCTSNGQCMDPPF